jgi:hypothetical protein
MKQESTTEKAGPDYLAQTAEPMTRDERLAWISARSSEAKAAGCQICRASVHEVYPDLIIFEGWRDRNADQSVTPAWQFAALSKAKGASS